MTPSDRFGHSVGDKFRASKNTGWFTKGDIFELIDNDDILPAFKRVKDGCIGYGYYEDFKFLKYKRAKK